MGWIRRTGIALIGLMAIAVLAAGCKWESNTAIDPKGDAERAAKKQEAREKALQGLPDFWQRLDANAGTDATYSVKVKMPDGSGGTEEIWISGLMRIDQERFRGALADTPKNMPGKKMGDIVEFNVNDVVDWWILRADGRTEGRHAGY